MVLIDDRAKFWIRLRVSVAAGFFLALLAAVFVRAIYIQRCMEDRLGDVAREQYAKELAVAPRRGQIVDTRGVPLAVSVATDSVVVNPKLANRPPKSLKDAVPVSDGDVERLAQVLKLEPGEVKKKFAQKGSFVWLKRRVTPQESAEVARLKLKGVSLEKEYKRYYPQLEVAAHVLGTVGVDNEGLEGVERAQDELLKGSMKAVTGLRDVRGNVLVKDGAPAEPAGGATVQVTIDSVIQHATEVALAEGTAKAKAVSGMAVVMDPATGAILAMANVPTFNPNAPAEVAARRNHLVMDQYEPGSTMKSFLMAAALSDKLIRPDTPFDVTGGVLQIGKKTVHDSHPPSKNVYTATEVLQYSSNVGSARIGMRMGAERLVSWFRAFGFGERTGLGLPAEVPGVFQKPSRMGDIGTATTAYGQGMTATPIQLVSALSAIANGGTLMRPYLVSKVIGADGRVLVEREPEAVRQVVTREVARSVTEMMKVVVEKGTGSLAQLPGYSVAGKTGTAQKANLHAKGFGQKRFSSFMGFVPAEAPRLAIYVALDEPDGDVYGGKIAAPIFKQVALAALQQLGVKSTVAPDPVQAAIQKREAGRDAKESRNAGRPEAAVAEAPGAVYEEGTVDDDAIAPDALQGNEISVPDLRGRSARAALRMLRERSLEAEVEGSGRAVTQSPEPGRLVAPGTRVRLVLGSG